MGRRDHALLVTLYNSGARVSEVTALKQGQVCFGERTFVQLVGKGRKERTIPLWADTARVLKAWFEELGEDAGHVAFPSARGKPLSRDGVDYLLKQTVQRAIPDVSQSGDQTHLAACDPAHHRHASAPSRRRYGHHCLMARP